MIPDPTAETDDPSVPASDEVPRRPRRVRRGVLLGLGCLVLLLLLSAAWAAVAGLRAKSGLEAVRSDLTAVRDHPPERADLLRRLEVDAGKAKVAHDQLHQLGPAVIGHLPLVGRSLVAERTIADAADAVLTAAVPAVKDTDGLGGSGTGLSLPKLATLHDALAAGAQSTAGPLKRLMALNTGLTPGIVSSKVHEAQTQLGGLSTTLGHAASLTAAVRDILGANGPRTIFVGLENNTELRGTGGLISTFTLAHAANGRLTIEPFRDSLGIAKQAEDAVTVPAPPDYVASYGGYLANTTVWLNATMDPDIPSSSSVLQALAQQSLHVKPDAVLLLDVAGMAKIVSATGPLHLSDGTTLSGDDLEKQLLVTEYGDGTLDQKVQAARHRKIAEAAGSGFAALASHESDVSVLKALTAAAGGRHLALWSGTPAVESELTDAGVSGSTDPHGNDLGLVTVNNLGDSPSFGNKLDYYATRSVDVKVVVGQDSAHVTQTLSIANHAPSGLGPYVEGKDHPGRMHLLISLAAAKAASLDSVTEGGKDIGVSVQRLSTRIQVTFPVDLQPGQQGTWQLVYDVALKDGRYTMQMLPQPLANPANLTVEVSAAKGDHLGTLHVPASGPWTSTHTLVAELKQPSWWNRKVTL